MGMLGNNLLTLGGGAAHACVVVVDPEAAVPDVGIAVWVWGAGCLAHVPCTWRRCWCRP